MFKPIRQEILEQEENHNQTLEAVFVCQMKSQGNILLKTNAAVTGRN